MIIRLSAILLHLNLILLQAHRGLLWHSSQKRKESTIQPRDLPTSSHAKCFWVYVTVWLWGRMKLLICKVFVNHKMGKPKSKVDTLSHFTFLDSTPFRNSSSKELILEPGYLREARKVGHSGLWTVGAECRKNDVVLKLPSPKRRWWVKKRTNGLQVLLEYEWIRDVLKQHDEKTKHKRLAWSQNTWQWSSIVTWLPYLEKS